MFHVKQLQNGKRIIIINGAIKQKRKFGGEAATRAEAGRCSVRAGL